MPVVVQMNLTAAVCTANASHAREVDVQLLPIQNFLFKFSSSFFKLFLFGFMIWDGFLLQELQTSFKLLLKHAVHCHSNKIQVQGDLFRSLICFFSTQPQFPNIENVHQDYYYV